MSDLRKIIADNICSLRTESGMTQARLGEILNYSDKAVSKWERGESVPDITVLKQIADLFGITVDYLLRTEHSADEKNAIQRARLASRNHLLITLISTLGVWVLASAVFVVLLALGISTVPAWLCYVYALPISLVVMLVLNSVWGTKLVNLIIISALVWSLILTVYVTALLLNLNLWFVFITGAPAQIIIFFVMGITVSKKQKCKEEGHETT